MAVYAIKARDVVIFSAHPRGKKKQRRETVRLMRGGTGRKKALPADILQCMDTAGIPIGAGAYVGIRSRSCYREGRGYGAFGLLVQEHPHMALALEIPRMVIDETANIEEAAHNTMLSKTSDFGVPAVQPMAI